MFEGNTPMAHGEWERERENDRGSTLGPRRDGSNEIAMSELGDSGNGQRSRDADDADFDEEYADDLRFYVQQIYFIIRPVVVCIILSIFWVKVAFSGSSDYR